MARACGAAAGRTTGEDVELGDRGSGATGLLALGNVELVEVALARACGGVMGENSAAAIVGAAAARRRPDAWSSTARRRRLAAASPRDAPLGTFERSGRSRPASLEDGPAPDAQNAAYVNRMLVFVDQLEELAGRRRARSATAA